MIEARICGGRGIAGGGDGDGNAVGGRRIETVVDHELEGQHHIGSTHGQGRRGEAGADAGVPGEGDARAAGLGPGIGQGLAYITRVRAGAVQPDGCGGVDFLIEARICGGRGIAGGGDGDGNAVGGRRIETVVDHELEGQHHIGSTHGQGRRGKAGAAGGVPGEGDAGAAGLGPGIGQCLAYITRVRAGAVQPDGCGGVDFLIEARICGGRGIAGGGDGDGNAVGGRRIETVVDHELEGQHHIGSTHGQGRRGEAGADAGVPGEGDARAAGLGPGVGQGLACVVCVRARAVQPDGCGGGDGLIQARICARRGVGQAAGRGIRRRILDIRTVGECACTHTHRKCTNIGRGHRDRIGRV